MSRGHNTSINLGKSAFTTVSCWYLCHHQSHQIDFYWSQAISCFNCREREGKINSNFSLQSLTQELTSVKRITSGIYPKELKAGTQPGTGLFWAASFTIAERQPQPQRPLAGDWMDPIAVHTCSGLVASLQKKAVLTSATSRLNLKDLKWNKPDPKGKCIIPLLWGSETAKQMAVCQDQWGAEMGVHG